MPEINYTAPPTVASFCKSQSFGRLIAGPVGSGKTTGCLFELFRRACEQVPAQDGIRYTRFAIVRQTLKQLRDTVLKDVISWLDGVATYKVSDNTVYIEYGDVRSEWLLIPLDDPEDQRRLLSLQLTGAWMSEAIEMNLEIVSPLSGRLGRYPSGMRGTPTWFGLIADTNMPTEGTPWHHFMENPSPDFQIFIQPGGMSSNAENLNFLPQTEATIKLPIDDPIRLAQGRKYYERFIRSNTPDWCERYVHARYGNDPTGTAVHRETFKKSFHVVKAEDGGVTPVSTYPLVVGLDFGRDPCAIICQPDHRGRLLVLEEIIAEDTGLELQLQRSIKPALLKPEYFGRPIIVVGDPSGTSKSTLYEESSFDMVKREGFNAYPAPTNDIDRRVAAVDSWLLMQRDGGPGMLIDEEKCPVLIRALSGGYRYARMRNGQRKPTPDKNEYSHVMDALQYACLATMGGITDMVASRMRRSARAVGRPAARSAGGWT